MKNGALTCFICCTHCVSLTPSSGTDLVLDTYTRVSYCTEAWMLLLICKSLWIKSRIKSILDLFIHLYKVLQPLRTNRSLSVLYFLLVNFLFSTLVQAELYHHQQDDLFWHYKSKEKDLSEPCFSLYILKTCLDSNRMDL